MGPSCDPSGRTEIRSWIDQGLKLGMVGTCSLDIVEFPIHPKGRYTIEFSRLF